MMRPILIAVFNHNRARFMHRNSQGQTTEVAELTCPEAMLPGHELYSDAPSKTQDSFGNRHAYEPRSTAREKLRREFSRKIAGWLDTELNHFADTGLVLVAPADMLGAVRNSLGHEAGKRVLETYAKNLVKLDVAGVIAALPAVFGPKHPGLTAELSEHR